MQFHAELLTLFHFAVKCLILITKISYNMFVVFNLSAMYPAAIVMFVIGMLTSDQVSIILTCLRLWGLCASYRSGSQTNQIEIAPRYYPYIFTYK